jgi:hypothetical protein
LKSLNFHPVNGNTGIGTNRSAVGTAGASVGVCHVEIVVSFGIYVFVERYDARRTLRHTYAASFTLLGIYRYRSFKCHDKRFNNNFCKNNIFF